MKVGKPKSKRVSVRLRHKIEKASANKQRKERKDAKKNPQWQSRLKKDPGIPNLFPYKDKVLAEIEESKRRKEEEQQRKRELAKAQREGRAVAEKGGKNPVVAEDEDDEDLIDPEMDEDVEGEDGDEMEEDTNPMAALLASAQARASAFTKEDDEDEDDEDDEEQEVGASQIKKTATVPTKTGPKPLPKQALADPIKAVSTLIERLQKTQDGIQQLLDHYQLPPLVTANSDTTTRFLVDVARKRGRLGRGGIPNLNGAALTVLSDLNEERMKLPALQQVRVATKSGAATSKGEVQIVTEMAQPFRIEGLFGDTFVTGTQGAEMDIEP